MEREVEEQELSTAESHIGLKQENASTVSNDHLVFFCACSRVLLPRARASGRVHACMRVFVVVGVCPCACVCLLCVPCAGMYACERCTRALNEKRSYFPV